MPCAVCRFACALCAAREGCALFLLLPCRPIRQNTARNALTTAVCSCFVCTGSGSFGDIYIGESILGGTLGRTGFVLCVNVFTCARMD